MDDLTEILCRCVSKNASDLHLSAGEIPRVRILGKLVPLGDIKFSHARIIHLIQAILQEKGICLKSLQENKKDADFSFEIQDLARFRVNLFFSLKGLSLAIRILNKTIPTIDVLGLPFNIKEFIFAQTSGLILLTGSTGSGKSTTLAAIIKHINQTENKHIITLEDPIEFVFQSNKSLIQQREIKTHTESFHLSLRSALREDPDIIVIGELRDHQSIQLALEASETGHLVLATMHVDSVVKAVDRMICLFDKNKQQQMRLMLSEALKLVLTQQLVQVNEAKRQAAFEVLVVDRAVSNLIRENKENQLISVMQSNQAKGMQTMDDAIKQLNVETSKPNEMIF